jgi:AcrR family transcriptional regulator
MSSAGIDTPSPARAPRADAVRNRELVLAAAREQFAEHGLDAQMDEIARAAGVGVGTVYRHFPNKDSLLEALAQQRFDAKAQAARDALEIEDPWEGFVAFMTSATRITAGDLALSEAMGQRPGLCREAAERAGLFAIVTDLVERAHASGQLREDIRPEDIPSLVSGVGHAVHAGDRGAPAMSWDRYLEIVLAGLRNR